MRKFETKEFRGDDALDEKLSVWLNKREQKHGSVKIENYATAMVQSPINQSSHMIAIVTISYNHLETVADLTEWFVYTIATDNDYREEMDKIFNTKEQRYGGVVLAQIQVGMMYSKLGNPRPIAQIILSHNKLQVAE